MHAHAQAGVELDTLAGPILASLVSCPRVSKMLLESNSAATHRDRSARFRRGSQQPSASIVAVDALLGIDLDRLSWLCFVVGRLWVARSKQ